MSLVRPGQLALHRTQAGSALLTSLYLYSLAFVPSSTACDGISRAAIGRLQEARPFPNRSQRSAAPGQINLLAEVFECRAGSMEMFATPNDHRT